MWYIDDQNDAIELHFVEQQSSMTADQIQLGSLDKWSQTLIKVHASFEINMIFLFIIVAKIKSCTNS